MMAMAAQHPASRLVAANMIRMGASTRIADKKGKTAVDYAFESKDEVKAYLVAGQ